MDAVTLIGWGEPDAMSPAEMRGLFAQLGLSQSAAARFVGVDVRSVQRWLSGEAAIQPAAARLLRRVNIKPCDVMKILNETGGQP